MCSTRFADRVDQEPDDLPVELRPRDQRQPARRRRLAGGAGARARRPPDARRRARWPGSTSRSPATSTTCSSAPRCRSCCPPGLQHLEAFSEALADGAWGRGPARAGEKLRQGADLEHWGAFQESFRTVAEMVVQVAAGERGSAPRTVTFLSGDVHHSYVSEVTRLASRATAGGCRAGCSRWCARRSATRCRAAMRFATAVLSYGVAGVLGRLAARSTHVPDRRSAGGGCAGRGSTTTWPPPR